MKTKWYPPQFILAKSPPQTVPAPLTIPLPYNAPTLLPGQMCYVFGDNFGMNPDVKFDGVPAPIDSLPAMRDVGGESLELIVDGGMTAQ